MKCFASIVFGLFVIWTGILRSIEAQAFKPNAFWFCLTMGLLAIAGGYLFRLGRTRTATGLAAASGLIVLIFYVNCLIVQPEKDACYRVGLVIVAAIGHLALVFLPKPRQPWDKENNL